MKIAVLSNVNVDFLLGDLQKAHETYKPEGYGGWVQDLIDPRSAVAGFGADAVFVLLDGEELVRGAGSAAEATKALAEAAAYLATFSRAHPETSIFASTIDVPHNRIVCLKDGGFERHCESDWSAHLAALNRDHHRFYVFELKRLIEEVGRAKFYSAKLWYSASIKYSLDGHKAILAHLSRCLRALRGQRKKVVVLDLDNTLWGGVLGEDGIDGIELSEHNEGARFKDFQKRLKEIKDTGVILTIASKNNPADVWEAFEQHPDMVLHRADFIDPHVNWEVKTANIRAIAEALNLGLDAMAFVDDNPVEREAVRSEIPELTVANFPADSATLARLARDMYEEHFLALSVTAEDRERSEMYQQNQHRAELLTAAVSHDDFLRSLETVIRMRAPRAEDVARVAQLTQKTNQFNVTTRRYTEAEIVHMLSSNRHRVYAVWVDDKFGPNGLVSVAIVVQESPTSARIDSFLMSCRVMSRYVEDQIVGHIEGELKRAGVETLYADFIPTKKNPPVVDLFDRLGYDLVKTEDDGAKRYKLDLGGPAAPSRKTFGELVVG